MKQTETELEGDKKEYMRKSALNTMDIVFGGVKMDKKRTAFYIQYWFPKEAGPSADFYYWGGAYDSLRKALDAANECEKKKPEAFDLEIYSREEKWITDEEDPRFGHWESIDNTTKIYDRRGAVVWSESEIEPKAKETPLEKWEREAKTKDHRFGR